MADSIKFYKLCTCLDNLLKIDKSIFVLIRIAAFAALTNWIINWQGWNK